VYLTSVLLHEDVGWSGGIDPRIIQFRSRMGLGHPLWINCIACGKEPVVSTE